MNIGIDFEYSFIKFNSSFEKPVVAITIGIECFFANSNIAKVACGIEK